MTVQEVLNIVKPKSVTLTDGSTTTWNFSSGNVAYWALSGNNTLSITNISSGQTIFGALQITQGIAGNFIPVLPGNVDAVVWKLNPGDVNWINFAYDGTNYYWGSMFVIPVIYGGQLLSPGSFTATPASNTEIDLTWSSSSNANNYVVDRALDAGFTSGVSLGIYNNSGTSFNDTGLTLGTQYFYRIKAQDTTNVYRDSSYATANGTTTGGLVTVNGFATFTQSPTGTWASPTSPGFDKAAQTMIGDGYFQSDLATTSNSVVLIGLDTSSTINSVVDGSSHMQWKVAIYIASTAGNNYTIYGLGENSGNAIDSGISWTAGDKQRLRRVVSTGALIAEKSSDGGATWTTVHSFTTTSTATLYLKSYIANNSNKLLNPKGLGIA